MSAIPFALNFNSLACKILLRVPDKCTSVIWTPWPVVWLATWNAYSCISTLSLPWWRCAMCPFSCRRGKRDELLLKHADTAWGQSEELCTLCMLKVFACWRCVSRSREKSFVGEWRLYCEFTFTYFSAYRLKLVYLTLSEITNYYKFYTHKINISTTNLTTFKWVGNKEY